MFEEDEEIIVNEPKSMGGKGKSKRRVNPALGKWVAFVKKVQKDENISYKEAMTRAKARKDKGEKWMGGATSTPTDGGARWATPTDGNMRGGDDVGSFADVWRTGGRRKTHKKRGSRKRRHTRRQRGGGSNLLRKYNN